MRLAFRCLLLPSLLAAGLLACGVSPEPAEPTEPAPGLYIRATFDDGQPLEGVTVLLDGQKSGRTDSTGQLTLDVPAGQHTLRLHLDAGEGRESQAEQSVEVGIQAQEVKVELPRPVRMLEPLEVMTSQVHLTWERSKEKNFREYKVYMARSGGVDEKTGELVYVGTDSSRTDYLLKAWHQGGNASVSANTDLYFRVFVLKEDGSLAGSNVLHVKTPRWDNEPHFTRFYGTTVERQFAGAWPIHGVAYDGNSLWLLYRQDVGGYYDNDKLTLVKLEPGTHQALKEFSFEDHLVPHGLTWDGASLWVNFDNKLERFNPSTGAREQRFMASGGAESVTWTGSHLLRSKGYIQGKIEQVDPATGAATETLSNPFTQHAGSRATGIAYRPGEIWVSDMWHSGSVIIDDAGVHIGFVNNYFSFAHMVFMGEKLVGVTGSSQVYIMKIQQ
jgi:hypothetical protein